MRYWMWALVAGGMLVGMARAAGEAVRSAEQPSPQAMAEAAGVTLPKLPWHVANIWWDLDGETAGFEKIEQEFTVDRDVPSTMNLYIAPVGVAMISGKQCYGGVQTNINGWADRESRERVFRGKGAIFSRWSNDKKTPIGLDHVRTAADECLVESAGYEGEFASVRRPFAWTRGTYIYRIRKGATEVVEGRPQTWFVCEIEPADGSVFEVGSLRFEGDSFTFWNRHSAFVEVYSTRQIPKSHIPAVEVRFGWPRINGEPAKVKKASAYYPNKPPQDGPDCATVEADGDACVVKVGPIFQRDESTRRHALKIVAPE